MTKIILDKKAIPSLLGVIMAFQIAGAIVGFSTAPGVDGWYQGLQKSPLTPPDYLFGVVWSVLYLFLAIVFWRWVRRPASREKSHILKLFVGHMVLNWAWSFIFFQLHAMVVAFIAILLILITALYLAWRFYGADRLSFSLMLPYIVWLIFAGYLSFYILLYN